MDVSSNGKTPPQALSQQQLDKLSRNGSRTSSNTELENDMTELDLNGSGGGGNGNGNGNGSVPPTGNGVGKLTNTLKKRNSRTPMKAKRVKFYRNGDKFFSGITIPISNEKYRSYDSLAEDLTRILEGNVTLTGAIRCIYSIDGKKIEGLEDLEDGKSYVCSCNNETFKKLDYNNLQPVTVKSNRLSRSNRPSSPLKNGTNGTTTTASVRLSERDAVVHPRIVTLIRNGLKPRKTMRLLLNKRNSPSYDHVLTAITQAVNLDTGCVRKVFTLSGVPVLKLADFFGQEDTFFAYGNERVGADDFDLEPEESKAINQAQKSLRGTAARNGPKPQMPIRGPNDSSAETDDERAKTLPPEINNQYLLGASIGDGNFAIVLKLRDKFTGLDYALKIIDKSKCKGKEHYIDAEVRVMKKLNHPNIIRLYLDIDTTEYMYLVLELVNGGDLFDAITRVTRFSENQARVMIKNLAAAMAYLHSMSIVHRDIKPENLLVELDNIGNVTQLKLADFGLACEVNKPLKTVCGTPTYVAPEILMETGYGLKIDVWAAGIILYILLCGFPPFVSPENHQEELFDAILAGQYEFPEPYWDGISLSARDLINNMLQSEPDLRFSSEDVLDHHWLLEEDAASYIE